MKRFFLFDLDGTLVDTGPGIHRSVRYALGFFGFPDEPDHRLRRFVGPPLDESFRVFYGLDRPQSFAAVEKFREVYRTQGVFQSPLYPGMDTLLRRLSAQATLCLATSKPLVFAQQILTLRGIRDCFTHTVGANLDGTMTDKAQVIGAVLRRLGDPDPQDVVMVGDRRHDILGAQAHHLETVGVTYGYAEPGELTAAGADHIVPTVAALEALCLSLSAPAGP